MRIQAKKRHIYTEDRGEILGLFYVLRSKTRQGWRKVALLLFCYFDVIIQPKEKFGGYT